MSQQKMGLDAVWAMAAGGMVGGGIFSVLGGLGVLVAVAVFRRHAILRWAA